MADETNQEELAPEASLAMSDEDFLNLNGPAQAGAAAPAEAATETSIETPATGEGEAAAAEPAEAPAEAETAGGEAEPEAKAGEEKPADPAPTSDKVEETPAEPAAEIDYKAAYDKLMGPIKANGKLIELRNPEEAVQLMQMGANYTKKMQELQPNLKIVTMLGNNGLLDEGKLSFLIDLDKKDPAAIRKLIKDSGIDVLDIDPEVDPAYEPGSHAVSDEEVTFRSATAELVSTPEGRETISEINSRWDQASKEALWTKPEIMATIHQARELGVYDQIVTEMDRLITLGRIPANTPFLEAYSQVGDLMIQAAQQQDGTVGQQPAGQQPELSGIAPQPVATKAAAPKSPLANDDKAKAASPTRTGAKKAEVFVNPLGQSDEQFLKQMEGRV
jgi:hypothetical protein